MLDKYITGPLLFEILEQIYDGVIIVDENSNIIYMNRSNKSLISRDNLIGKKVEELEPDSKLLSILKHGMPVYSYRQVIETVGLEFTATSFPIKKDGKVSGAIAIGRIMSADQMYNFLFAQGGARRTSQPIKLKSTLPAPFQKLIGEDSGFVNVLFKGAAAADTESNVLVLGESGVGKEVFCKAIHQAGRRSKSEFVVVNCAAIPENLLESELFGYEPGSFTSASARGKKGKLELAHQGTLFLDEIGDLSPALQAKLLRAIQFKSFERVGGNRQVNVDIRIIAATNKNLWQMVKEGKFRADLFYRLNVFPITIPPLRERKNDIITFSYSILNNLASNQQLQTMVELTKDTIIKLQSYEWPGNIRELENVLEHAFIIAASEGGSLIQPRHLPGYMQKSYLPDGSPNDYISTVESGRTLKEIVEEFEIQTIRETMQECGNNKSHAIKKLGMSKGAFYRKLKQHLPHYLQDTPRG